METLLEPAIPVDNDDVHSEGEKLFGFAGLFWAVSMQRLYQEAQQSMRHSAMIAAAQGQIGAVKPLTRKEFLKGATFQVMVSARGLCLLARVGMPFIFVMQMRELPAPPAQRIRL